MTWLLILLSVLVCVSFSTGFLLGVVIAAWSLESRRQRPPVLDENPPLLVADTENGKVIRIRSLTTPYDQDEDWAE